MRYTIFMKYSKCIHFRFFVLILLIGLVGCTKTVDLSSDWTAEECSKNFNNALEQIDTYSQQVIKKQQELTELERIGGYEKSAEQLRISIDNLKNGQIAGNVQYIENDVFAQCDEDNFTDDQLTRLSSVKQFISQEQETFIAEDLPDIRVATVTTTFVPFEEDEAGSCRGPFMDVRIVVTNYGADFPRAVDWEQYTALYDEGKIATSPASATLVGISSELDFGDRIESVGTTATRNEFADGVFNSGESYTYETRVPIYDNEINLKITSRVRSGHTLFKTNSQGWDSPHQESVVIPMWDIYPHSSATIRGTDESGQQTAETKLTITNLGSSATPGSITANFSIHNSEDESSVALWSGETFTSLGPDAFDDILGDEQVVDEPLVEDIIVKASLHLRCPSGQVGSLADGDTSNNRRVLKTQ